MRNCNRRVFAAACASLLAAAPVVADEQGELWETTAQASMPGMPVNMPAYTAKVCKKPNWTTPPQTTQDPNQNCKPTEFNRTGDTITWKMACENPPMSGEGELTFHGTDSYEGQFTMHGGQFNMLMHLTGKKVGTCDNPK